jgi:cobalamin biosynthesis protein CobT
VNRRARDAPAAHAVAVEIDDQDPGSRRVRGVGGEDEVAERPGDDAPARGRLDSSEDMRVGTENDLRAGSERGRGELTLT